MDLEDHLVGKIFEPLKNLEFFKNFELDSGTFTWPKDSDFSPEFLYDLALNKKRKGHNTALYLYLMWCCWESEEEDNLIE